MVLMPLLSRLLTLLVILTMPFFFQAEDGIRDRNVTGVQTCALPICRCRSPCRWSGRCARSARPPRPGRRSEERRVGKECRAMGSTDDFITFYVTHRHVYGEQGIKFMKDGVNATPLPTVNTTGYIDHAFFFSSRRRHTRSKRDWSSDVCSSDLSVPIALSVVGALREVGETSEARK